MCPGEVAPDQGRRHCRAFRAPLKACALTILSENPVTVPLRASGPHGHALEAIRKELYRSTKQRVETGEIERLLRETVLRPECFD